MPKKTKGVNKPLDVSAELANIIGTKKGEQVYYLTEVIVSVTSSCMCCSGVKATGDQEALCLHQGE